MGNLSFWLSKKLSGNSHGDDKTGKVIAILGVAFAVAVMEITMAVSVGFKKEITAKLEGFIAPVSVTAPLSADGSELSGMLQTDSMVIEPIKNIVPEAELVPTYILQGLLKTDLDFAATALKAYDTTYTAAFERGNMVEGRWLSNDGRREIVLSSAVATPLGIHPGDRLTFCYIVRGNMKARPLEVVGIYDSGFSEFDKLVSYVNPEFIRNIYHAKPGEISALELRNIDVYRSQEIGESLKQKYYENALFTQNPDRAYNVMTVAKQGAVYLNWLELLDTNVVVIFILMAFVAACTLVSSLFIQVLQKVNAIGLLRAIGANNGLISRCFVYLSLRLVGWGMLIGNVIGLGFIFTQNQWHYLSLNPEMYYLKHVPVYFELLPIILLNIGVMIAAWLILILPAKIATRMSPSATLRFD